MNFVKPSYLLFPDALFAEVAVPGLALISIFLAVVALLSLVSPVIAVDVAVAHLLLINIIRALAHVLVGVVLEERCSEI